MIDELTAAYGNRLTIAVLGVGLGLACLLVVFWVLKRRGGSSPFVRGGKNRQPRLQVLDAAAVDTRRRLVLVRRDDVEHLIMIGGPTDIVIESGIGEPRNYMHYDVPPQRPGSMTKDEAPLHDEDPAAKPSLAVENARYSAQIPAQSMDREAVSELQTTALSGQPSITSAATTPGKEDKPGPVAANDASRQQRNPQPAEMSVDAEKAAAALDAARERVMAQPDAAPSPRTTGRATSAPARNKDGLDFEQVLEMEMAGNLRAQGLPSSAPSKPVSVPFPATARRDPTVESKSDPNLQTEIARIFGEMSATRDEK